MDILDLLTLWPPFSVSGPSPPELVSGVVFGSTADNVVDLGRFRYGDRVRISITPDGIPDDVPVMSVSYLDGTVVATGFVTPVFGSRGEFRVEFSIGHPTYNLDVYHVDILFEVHGVPYNAARMFEVVPGGNPGGQIISLFAANRPEGVYALAHTNAGMVRQGNNPQVT